MTRYAVLSDVHSNLHALQAVFADASRRQVSAIWYLGDVVVYGPRPRECLALLLAAIRNSERMSELAQFGETNLHDLVIETQTTKPMSNWTSSAVKGNNDYAIAENKAGDHVIDDWAVQAGLIVSASGSNDTRSLRLAATQNSHEWTRRILTTEEKALLRGMSEDPLQPTSVEEVLLVHASPCEVIGKEGDYLRDVPDAEEAFFCLNTRPNKKLCFFGHTHHAAIFEQTSDSRVYDNCQKRSFSRIGSSPEIQPIGKARMLINPGSVGQPRDGDWRASYVIYDTDQQHLEFYRLEYPLERTIQDLRDLAREDRNEARPLAMLADAMADRLRKGI